MTEKRRPEESADVMRNFRDYRPVLRLWEHPSFAPSATWVLFEHQTNGQILARFVDWRTPQDEDEFELFADPQMETPVAVIPHEEIEPILRELNATPVPLTGIEVVLGLDGCKYGIERLDSFARVLLEWWQGGPKEWRAYTRAVARLRKLLWRYAPGDDSAR